MPESAVDESVSLVSLGEFVREGTMVALPLCFPGQSSPPPRGETAATVLALDPAGAVYCGTRGTRAHVLAAFLRGDAGVVLDLGAVPGADSVDGLAVHGEWLSVLASGPQGAALWRVPRSRGSFFIQEWSLVRHPYEEVARLSWSGGATAEATADGRLLCGVTDGTGEAFCLDAAEGRVVQRWAAAEEGRCCRRIGLDAAGRLWGTAGKGRLWTADPQTGSLRRLGALPAAAGRSQHAQASAWALDPVTGILYGGTSPDGFLFRLDPRTGEALGFGKPVRQQPLTCLAVGHDGTLFGMGGAEDEIGHLFRHDPQTRASADLGVPVSTLTVRQYGYHFRCALTGPDGEIWFGQHESVNWIWVYFPRIPIRRTT